MNLQTKTPYFKRNAAKNISNTQGNNILNAFVNIPHLPSTAPATKRRQQSLNFFREAQNTNQPQDHLTQTDRAYQEQKEKWIELRERLRMRQVFTQDRPKTSVCKKDFKKSKIEGVTDATNKNNEFNVPEHNTKPNQMPQLFDEDKQQITQILKNPQKQELQSQCSTNKQKMRQSYKSARITNRTRNINASQSFRQMIKIYTAKNNNKFDQMPSKDLNEELIIIKNNENRKSRGRKHRSQHYSHISKEMEDKLNNRPQQIADRRIIYRKTQNISSTAIYSLEISIYRKRTIIFVELIGEKYKKFTHVLPIEQSVIFNEKLKSGGDAFVGQAIEINLIEGIIINMNALKLQSNAKAKLMRRQPSKQSNLSRNNINRIDSKSILIGDKLVFRQQYPTKNLKSNPSSSNLESENENVVHPQPAQPEQPPQNNTIVEESISFIKSIPEQNNSKLMGASAIVSQIEQSKQIG